MVSIRYAGNEMNCVIDGKTWAATAETATFFFSLKDGEDVHIQLGFFSSLIQLEFDFTVLRPEQLAQFLDANRLQDLRFPAGNFSAEQSAILATRPSPLKLDLGLIQFIDDGTAFVDALEERQSSFGTRRIQSFGYGHDNFSADNLRRLFNLEIIEKLGVLLRTRKVSFFPFPPRLLLWIIQQNPAIFKQKISTLSTLWRKISS